MEQESHSAEAYYALGAKQLRGVGGATGRNFRQNPKERWLLEANKGTVYKSGATQENGNLLLERDEAGRGETVRLWRQAWVVCEGTPCHAWCESSAVTLLPTGGVYMLRLGTPGFGPAPGTARAWT